MKKLLLLLLCLPLIGFGQLTMIPDTNFEQALINLGYDTGTPNGSVPTASMDTVTSLYVFSCSISDLTGIEDFTALTDLECQYNNLTSLDVSQNTALTFLECQYNNLTSLDVSGATALSWLNCRDNQLTTLDVSNNTALTVLNCMETQLTTLDVSNNTALTHLYCSYNQLTALNVSQNTALRRLRCDYNQLTSLDLSANPALTWLVCQYNNLTTLDIRNGNNISMDYTSFFCAQNPNLTCIDIDNTAWSTTNWTVANGNIDPQHYFSNNCSGTAIEEHTTNKKLLKVTDILGRETTNQPLFYIYDDGTVEKRIVIE